MDHSSTALIVDDSCIKVGRGPGTYKHAGNVRFRSMVKTHVRSYQASTKQSKTYIVNKVHQEIISNGMKFIEMNKEDDNLWKEVDQVEGRRKVAHRFRDAAAEAEKRKVATCRRRRKTKTRQGRKKIDTTKHSLFATSSNESIATTDTASTGRVRSEISATEQAASKENQSPSGELVQAQESIRIVSTNTDRNDRAAPRENLSPLECCMDSILDIHSSYYSHQLTSSSAGIHPQDSAQNNDESDRIDYSTDAVSSFIETRIHHQQLQGFSNALYELEDDNHELNTRMDAEVTTDELFAIFAEVAELMDTVD